MDTDKTDFAVNLRRWWVRLPITIFLVGGTVLAADFAPNRALLRRTLIDALPSTLFVFGIMIGLVSYLISNHVRGVHAAAVATVARARNVIWSFRDRYRDADDPAIEGILVMNLLDLSSLKEEDWFEPNNIRSWSTDLDEHLQGIEDPRDRVEIFSRYLMPIQEAVDELTLLYVRSVIGELNLSSISGTFTLLVVAIAVNVVIRILPNNRLSDLFAIGLVVAIMVMALIELLMVFGFVSLEVSEESYVFRRAEEAWAKADKSESEPSDAG